MISLIQTAEGALNETHAILQRMRELAVQSSNDTNTPSDRVELQKEVDQLAEELTRIAENTEFNTQNLLGKDGKGFEGKFHIGANSGQSISLEINDMGAKALGVNKVTPGTDVKLDTHLTLNSLTDENYTIKYTAAKTGNNDAAVTETTAVEDKDAKTITITLAQGAGDGNNPGSITATIADVAKALESTGLVKVTIANGQEGTTANVVSDETTLTAGMVETTKGIDISSQESANSAITVIDKAIETVSAERSKLGAVQNRLEHTINNLSTSSENLTAAESRIRDVDYALAA
ncbi:flagellin [Caldifermentibacillus hisashii]|uniref:flagellin N-terminal helical domain-containing protein n=1 Tax=Caldifermentibacillus hisashii TaxID=996558 RepID=UPI003418C201